MLMSKAEAFENVVGEIQDFREAYYYLFIGKSGLMDVSGKLQELRRHLNQDCVNFTCLIKKGQKLVKMQTWFCK